ncbi:MAG: glycosyltransferase family 2 protein, partial [Bacilli bacterium]
MEKVSIVSTINSGIKNPNITVILDIAYNDFDVEFYSNGRLEHKEEKLNVLPEWCKVSDKSHVYVIQPKLMKKVYVEVKHKGKVVAKLKVTNGVLSAIRCKIKVYYNSILKTRIKTLGLRRGLVYLVPKKYRQRVYNKVLTGIRKRVEDDKMFYLNKDNIYEYSYWIDNFEKFSEVKDYEYTPKISVVIPVYNCPTKYLRECLDSILTQTYQNFEICICDDASTDEGVVAVLKEYEKLDSRIKVFYSEKNGHISKATNNALSIATGEYIAFMDNDDTLSPFAFNEVIKVLNENKNIDLIYSDEDKMNMEGKRVFPHFKPDFSPETLLGINYICHLVVVKRVLVSDLGGIREGFEGVQDHDFLLRLTEITSNIVHIPKILYHWRMIPGSTAVSTDNKPYVLENGVKMVEETLERRSQKGKVSVMLPGSAYSTLLENKDELVSIIIPTRDGSDILSVCLKSIYEKTTYKNYEIIVVDNG